MCIMNRLSTVTLLLLSQLDVHMNNTSRAAELDLHDSHSENELPVRAASPYLTRGSITGNRQPSAVPRSRLESTVCYDGLCMHL